ncbi:MAG: phenylalanine--tRNA ligase subunit beta [Nitrospirota bacterium]
MKASYNWLKEFVDFDLPHEELAHTLTMAGFEVEAIEEYEDDIIFDIGVTPNRPDCLSIRGIAREIAAILDLPFKDVTVEIASGKGDGPAVKIEDPDLCFRYSSRTVSGVKPGPSPSWLVKRLESCGFRTTSNIVDITNYILLELGHPMHAFDLDKLRGGNIIVKSAGNKKEFVTLDEEKRKLSNDMLLIWDSEKPVAIAGVMGGRSTEVSESTNNILLESAYFMPSSVRRTSKSLNLSTESSYRFERGVDIDAVTLALNKAAQMIKEIAGGEISGITDEYPGKIMPKEISVSFEKINSLIGVDIEKSFIEKTLRGLGFVVKRKGQGIVAIPPSFRNDAERDIDIIEEVARLYGYDRIPSTLPVMQMSAASEHRTQKLIKSLKDSMVKSGFSEAINFSFLSPDILDQLNLGQDDRRRDLIYIKNPLRQEESAMRTTLIPALLNNVSLNLNRGEKMLRLFEISRVFLSSKEKLPHEVTQLTAVFHKENTASIWHNNHDCFYDLKGVIENIFQDLRIKGVSFVVDGDSEPYLHPGKSSSIIVNEKKVGSIGILHPGTAETFDIKSNIAVAEIYDIKKIMDLTSNKITYAALPKYPYVERDVALVVRDDITSAAVRKEILDVESDIIESVNLFDIYKGKPIPPDKKSLAFSIRFRSPGRTLTDEEVDNLHSSIRLRLKENLNAELRS